MQGYRGHRVAVATQHGKAEALAPALSALGLQLQTVDVDTDALGTFAGEVERPGTAREVVVAKARLGMTATGLPLGIATEGSFGPDPLFGFLPLHQELLAFVDDLHGQVIVLEHSGHDTNWMSKPVRPGQGLAPLLEQMGAPTHAVLVRPNTFRPGMPVAKGLREEDSIAAAIEHMAGLSEDGLARLEADLRAHVNPTRLRWIGRLGESLRDRLLTPCPACGVPGFGLVEVETGLPCELCGTPTDSVRAEILGCGACAHREARPRLDGRASADAGHCPECNP